jgi:hypothetical protein
MYVCTRVLRSKDVLNSMVRPQPRGSDARCKWDGMCLRVRLIGLRLPSLSCFPEPYQTGKQNSSWQGATAKRTLWPESYQTGRQNSSWRATAKRTLWRGWGGRVSKNVAPPAPPAAPPSLFPFALEAVAGAREGVCRLQGSSLTDGGGTTCWRRLHRLRGRLPPQREPPQRRPSQWSS